MATHTMTRDEGNLTETYLQSLSDSRWYALRHEPEIDDRGTGGVIGKLSGC
jgi:hypothetical protein